MVNTEKMFCSIEFTLLFLGEVIRLLEEALQRPLSWFVCMQTRCLYVISLRKLIVKLLVLGAFQDQLVS